MANPMLWLAVVIIALTIASAAGWRVPLWVPVLLLGLVELLRVAPQ